MARNTVTLEKFVKRVASAVGRFLDVSPPILKFFRNHADF
jgi:hypothetical protein